MKAKTGLLKREAFRIRGDRKEFIVGAYVYSGIVWGLLLIAGVLLIAASRTNRKDKNSGILRWTGYGLLLCTLGLIVLEIYAGFEEASHRIGH